MNEEMLRALVRETIARLESRETVPDVRPLHFATHASHYRYTLPPSSGPCVIEPGVRCSHCGYCESHGY